MAAECRMDVRPNISGFEHVLCVLWNVAVASVLGLQGRDKRAFNNCISLKSLVIGDLNPTSFYSRPSSFFIFFIVSCGGKAPSSQS
jgi:hypothetical protein